MITFLDENDVEYGALATIKATNAVNGERSLTGTIASGDYVLSNIERGWRLRFDDEYYVVTYAKPIDEGKDVQVEFDAVHQFFWDFDKSSVYDQLTDGSHTFIAYLDFIFKNSGYSYTVDSALNVYAFEKQSFGFKKRLTLFNDIITSTGVEFQVNGKVVRILAKVGTDLSTVVRKNFNMNELTVEKNIGDFVTYQKGFGAYFDEEDHSKGRLEVEYTSPLASVYGRLEAEPFVDERYSQSSSLLAVLKENVDNSYSISVSLDMEDLTRAGYKYKQPIAGDYIMAINETLDFQEKIRIVSFTSEYAVDGQLIKHTVTCNDIGSVKKLSASYNLTKKQAASASNTANNAFSIANKALVSADGKNTNYYGDSFPVDNPKGTLKTGDLLFLTVGDTVKQYYWNGADWVINPVLDDVEAFKEQIAEELKDVPNREEFENKIAEEVATSKAEIETQIETAKTQAESNAKEYADTINGETAKVAELANAAAGEIKADLVNVKNNLTSTSLVANNAQAAVDAAKQELTEVANELSTAKQDLANSVDAVNTKVDSAKAELTQTKQQLTNVADDLSQAKTDLQNAVSAVDTKATNLQNDLSEAKQDLTSQAQQLQEQANAQTELAKRVTTVETTANGTKTTVSELSKTVAQNGKDITSVTARTKVVEDDLTSTKTTLSQVKTTADSASQKTATLETGLNGLSAKFENLKIGSVNLLKNSKTFTGSNITGVSAILNENYQGCAVRYFKNTNPNSNYQELAKFLSCVVPKSEGDYVASFWAKGSGTVSVFFYIGLPVDSFVTSQGVSGNLVDGRATFTLSENWQRYWVKYKLQATTEQQTVTKNLLLRHNNNSVEDETYLAGVQLEEGNIATDYSPNEADLEQKVAEYKQNADQNYASLQTTVQNLDGTVQHNKTVADQTAQGFSTRIESLETYKDGESERANAYFESAKTETAKQLTAERTAIAKDYVAKSTYTSDVTGIRNELSATTSTANATKTNLANYQASNDRAVANLQTNLQTANGNISSLQTKVEAVPGQITSAVSAVEGKIPTSVGARNYIRNYGLTATGWAPHESGWKFEIIKDSTAKSGQHLKATCTTAGIGLCGFYKTLFDFSDGRFFGKQMTWSMDFKTSKNTKLTIGCEWGNVVSDVNTTTNWQRFSKTFKVATSSTKKAWVFYGSNWNAGDIVYIRDVQLEDGSIATSPVPAIEDTQSDINAVSSEIKQTADGMTLLATKTEVNSAKAELQSGITTATNKANNNAQTISTHTSQISALNTGLSAKVSQSDFNTLSGRVTTAENNITAKANELSSKITSVEGKIPTSIGARNYIRNYGLTATGWAPHESGWKFEIIKDSTAKSGQHLKATCTTAGIGLCGFYKTLFDFSDGRFFGKQMTWSMDFKTSKNTKLTIGCEWGNVVSDVNTTTNWQRFSKTFKVATSSNQKAWVFYGRNWNVGDIVYIRDVQLEDGSIATSPVPAIEDTASDITKLSSELTQTKDGITLLATKTELNSAKNDLQSGINTATNKANAAQNTANNNAQTISTHTTQISALNTGLSAKVSQSDFNTLSGRVTTAENNITAKANELSSKITSVEGKIPTEIGGRNLYALSKNDKIYTSGVSEFNQNIETGEISYKVANVSDAEFGLYTSSIGTSYSASCGIKIPVVQGKDVLVSLTDDRLIKNYVMFWGEDNTLAKQTIKYTTSRFKIPASNLNNTSYLTFRFGVKENTQEIGTLIKTKVKIEYGNVYTDWTPAPEDTAEQISSLSSEFKQTTDSIKASVSSLDQSTIKSSSLTINSDGIVMKAGKSTTDVANAIGSYFAVNQNAINLFSDKINVKGNMIVSGAITSDKIASKSINTSHLNGKIITADVIATNAITADAIKAGAVTTDKMSANSINGDRIAAGTLDAAKIKAGSITASQIASGTITSNQIKAGGISSANIAAGAITGDKIAAGAIDASKIAANAITADKIAANAITADMITGGKLNSKNGATSFDLNAGTLTFNNNYGYIQRVASDQVFEITTFLGKDDESKDFLTSAFNIRKSDFSRLAGAEFALYNATADKPQARASIYADKLILFDSKNTPLFAMYAKGAFGNVNFNGWGDIPIANFTGCGLVVDDIGIGGHFKSLLKIVEELCKKNDIPWV